MLAGGGGKELADVIAIAIRVQARHPDERTEVPIASAAGSPFFSNQPGDFK